MLHHPRTTAAVTATAALLYWFIPWPRVGRVLTNVRTRWPALPWIVMWIVALVPMIWISADLRHYSINVPMLDDWEMAKLIVKQHAGTLHVADLFEQQQEGRTVLPKLVFVLSTIGRRWDVREQMMISIVAAWLTAAGIFFLLRRAQLSLVATAACLWTAVLLIFSPAQYEVWLLAMGFPSFLPALFIVAALVLLATRLSTTAKFLGCLLLAVAGSFTLPHGLLAWGLTFPVLFFTNRPPDWKRWLAAWVVACLACAALYFWGYQKPGYLPEFAPAVPLINYVLFFLVFLGGSLAYASTAHSVVVGAIAGGCALLLCATAAGFLLRRVRLAALAPWLALAAYAIASAFLATLGRVAYGPEYALASRYVPFSLYLLVAAIVLAALLCRELRTSGFPIQLLFVIYLLLGPIFLFTFKLSIDNTHFFLRGYSAKVRVGRAAVFFSRVLDTRELIKRIVYPAEPDVIPGLAAQLDDFQLLHPPLARSRAIAGFANTNGVSAHAAGRAEKLSSDHDNVTLTGWARLTKKNRAPDGIAIASAAPGEQWRIIAINDTVIARSDVAHQLRLDRTTQVWAGWSATFPASAVPAGAKLSVWAIDGDVPKFYKLEGEFAPAESR